MSIRSVNKQIRTALEDKVLTAAEAENIITTAEKGPLTTGETKAIADLYERGVFKFPNTFPAGALVQPRPPEYEMESGAEQNLMNFFVANRVPQGKTYGLVKEDIEAAIENIDYSSLELDQEPKTKHLHHVHIRDMRPVDGPRTDAFVDTNKDVFFLKVTGSGMAGPDTIGPNWYGPIDLKELSPTERIGRKIDNYSLARDMGLQTSRTHTPQVKGVEDLGDGTYQVTMAAVNWRDPSDVLDTKQAIVDEHGDFVKLVAGPGADEVKDKIDTNALAQQVDLNWNRTFTPRVAAISERDDGNYDVTLQAVHFMRPTDIGDTKRAVVNADGQYVPTAVPSVTSETRAHLKETFETERAGLDFKTLPPPMGQRFERVVLEQQPGFDTYTFTALVPVGALAPGAKALDPNEANSIFIERSGGFAGMTLFAGPVDVDCN